ncbi:flavin reductase family protein [Mycobacterium sp.]|uniref:flavin reductase family protein n=1 Tax=Mycobacterium sp. TaxID=1785 RepID=UPI002C1A3AA5|nr:flavin reductase family protein [Mycobacterium sp.]HKP42132.1 flavin reductase family protein [Mycobacterium sp.]
MTVDAADYRSVMRRHPAGVAIITLMSPTGPVGFTATSFASLSLEPPLVSFNISHASSSIAALRAADSVVVHLLGEHQLELAQRFSRSAEHRFAEPATWTALETGEPLLHTTPTWVRATVSQFISAGDSTLVIGLVTRTHCADADRIQPPLVYHDGTYLGTSPIEVSDA